MYEHLRGGLRNQIPKFQNPSGPILLTQELFKMLLAKIPTGNPYIDLNSGQLITIAPQPNLQLRIENDWQQFLHTDNMGQPIPKEQWALFDLQKRYKADLSDDDSGDDGSGDGDEKKSKIKQLLDNGLNSAKKYLALNAGQLANLGLNAANSWATSGVEQGEFMNGINGASNLVKNLPGIGEKASMALGTFTTGLNVINKLGGSYVSKYQADQNLMANMGSSYGGFSDLALRAADATGKTYGLFNGGGYGKAKRLKNEAIRQENIVSGINSTYQDQVAMAMNDANYTRYLFNLNGGWNMTSARAAKFGSKLERIRRITSKKLEEPIEEFAEDLWEPQLFKEGGTIEENTEDVFLEDSWEPLLFLEGGKTRTIQELIEYAKLLNPRFILRLSEPIKYVEWTDNNGEKLFGTHELGYAEVDGKYVIFPNILEHADKQLFRYADFRLALDNALKNKNVLWVDAEDEAKLFTESNELENGEFSGYKSGWPEFFKLKPKFLKGGKTEELLNLAKEYYKDYDLSGINLIEDNSPRTEGNNIYVSNDEDAIHELWHYLSKNKPNEKYKEFYDNLDDERIKSLGGDLDFVKRAGDPGIFYQPSELEARIMAAKYKSKGVNYTKDFFSTLRETDENKYGYNMRDLLHMYNDENLEKIFNLKNGGELSKGESGREETNLKNIIPEGALHKEKHHMENAEDLTKKGIPVIDNDGVLLAEIERDEIVFTLEVTKKLEDLYHKYYDLETSKKDDLAIEAGKILVYEILYNTEDRTNLISKCKEGGKLNET